MSAIFVISPNAIIAIAIRDMMARYGRNNIGILWALLEPIILAVGVMVLWSVIRQPYEHGVALMTIVFTGYLPLTLWRHVSWVGGGLFLRSGHYLYHRNISMMDIFLARVISEFAFTTSGTLLIYCALRAIGVLDPMERWDLVISGWLIMGALSATFLLFTACVTVYFEELEKFNLAIQYIILPISGCFFMMDWMSPAARDALWYVPLTHCYEMIRDGAFGRNVTTYYSPYYPLLWCLVFLISSIFMMRRVREELHGQ